MVSGRVGFFVTSNRVSPVVALYDEWPASARLRKSCHAGIYLGSRPMNEREQAAVAESCRCAAWRWDDLAAAIWDERSVGGREFARHLLRSVRRERSSIEVLLGIVAKARRKREVKRAAIKSARAGQRSLGL